MRQNIRGCDRKRNCKKVFKQTSVQIDGFVAGIESRQSPFIKEKGDMRAIHKFPLKVTDYQKIQLNKEAELLSVQVQKNIPCLWALVEPNNPTTEITIRIIGTGHPIEEDEKLSFINTIQLLDGTLIFHVFYVKV